MGSALNKASLQALQPKGFPQQSCSEHNKKRQKKGVCKFNLENIFFPSCTSFKECVHAGKGLPPLGLAPVAAAQLEASTRRWLGPLAGVSTAISLSSHKNLLLH